MAGSRWLLTVCGGLVGLAALALYLANHGVLGAPDRDGGGLSIPPGGAAPATLPPQKPVSVLFLGTSLTHGRDWPDKATARLTACRGAAVTAVTLARPGASSAWGDGALRAWLKDHAGAAPDFVVAEFAVNDASLLRGLTVSRSRHFHGRILQAARKAGARPVLMTMNPAFGRHGWERPGLDAYNALYRRMAAHEDITLIDTVPAWSAMPESGRMRLMPDGLHPTDQGMARVTIPAILDALAPVLCPKPSLNSPG
ncbi:MAG: SGNH/GDSL hydrolase family protein [Alphaproteobacteria bacterium]